jgi:hypothetical protein
MTMGPTFLNFYIIIWLGRNELFVFSFAPAVFEKKTPKREGGGTEEMRK